ncbi:MAG: hypothetical protein MUF25_10820 [Pirellulaceae bacterium]|nr:hypothetical protein [Pirellulaceae bacterium]
MWLLLSLVAVLFCLSVAAPREWSSWDSRPVGPASSASTLTFMDTTWQRPSQPDLATPLTLAAITEPQSVAEDPTQRDSGFSSQDQPKPTPAPLPTGTDRRREDFDFASHAAGSVEQDDSLPVEVSFVAEDTASGMAGHRVRSNPASLRATDQLPDLGVSRRTSTADPSLLPCWPCATALLAELDALSAQASCRDWCQAVRQRLDRLSAVDSLATAEVQGLLGDLNSLSAEGQRLARAEADSQTRSRWSCAVYSLKRRTNVWEQVAAIAARAPYVPPADGEDRSLQQAYDALAAHLRSVTNGDVWESYLLMDEARSRFFGELATDTIEGRNLAKRILMRADYSILSPSQQAFLHQPASAEYLRQLRRVATEPVDYPRLMAELERYEQERSAPAALHLAAAQQVLRWSDDEAVRELGQRLDTNYRNANLRISLSRSLMERMLPPPEPVAERVDEIIQGAYTTGCCETLTQLGVRLIPSANSWRIGLAAKGQVATETQSSSGPAMFHSRGNSVFIAAKEVVIHRNGCYHRAAVADAQTSNELACVSTSLDSVPLVGDLARAIAVDRYRADSQAAERAVQRRVAATASDRIDAEVSDRLNDVRKRFVEHFYSPLQKLALNPVAMDMATSQSDLVARFRLAGHHQLAAHTPRPVTPASSVFHMQVHESAVNNLLEQLDWEGRRANVRELHRQISELFALPPRELPEDLPDDVFVRFAGERPLRIAFQEGRVSLQLALAELSQGSNSWKNFTVWVHYRHDPTQPDADLVRDQYVELLGKRLHLRDQIALRGIFSRVFSQSKPIQLVSQGLKTDPRLAGLEIDQLEIRHGWLSLSLGEIAEKPRTAQGQSPRLGAAGASPTPAKRNTAQAMLVRVRSP